MGLLDRIFRVTKAEANAVVDKIEDPAKISQQILRELRENLQEAISGTAEIKALALQHRTAETENRNKAAEWEKKANSLLDRMEKNQLSEEDGNKLVKECLASKKSFTLKADEFKILADREDKAVVVMEGKIALIRKNISDTEDKATMISSRAKTAEAEEKINKTLSSVDTDGLMNTLNRMDEKTKAAEFRAQAYAEIDGSNTSSENHINQILNETSEDDELEALKAKRKLSK